MQASYDLPRCIQCHCEIYSFESFYESYRLSASAEQRCCTLATRFKALDRENAAYQAAKAKVKKARHRKSEAECDGARAWYFKIACWS